MVVNPKIICTNLPEVQVYLLAFLINSRYYVHVNFWVPIFSYSTEHSKYRMIYAFLNKVNQGSSSALLWACLSHLLFL